VHQSSDSSCSDVCGQMAFAATIVLVCIGKEGRVEVTSGTVSSGRPREGRKDGRTEGTARKEGRREGRTEGRTEEADRGRN
jgi:hypothetical protein